MKYFFLAYAIIAALFIGLMPMRGDKSPNPPIWIFPDMDNQDKLKAQDPSHFFADGVGSRQPVAGTQPLGFLSDGARELGGIPSYEFGGVLDYYHTGGIEGYYGHGLPKEELSLTPENMTAFLRRGKERYDVNCTVCHGASGNGQGVTVTYGVPGVANLLLENYHAEKYPDGRLYDVIAHGKGNMGGYKHNLSVRDRWAIVAYVRALQLASAAPLDDPEVKAAYERAQAATNSR